MGHVKLEADNFTPRAKQVWGYTVVYTSNMLNMNNMGSMQQLLSYHVVTPAMPVKVKNTMSYCDTM